MPASDDPRAEKPTRYILTGIVSMVALALVVAVLLVPPMLIYSAMRKGHSLLAIGLAGVYAFVLGFAASRLFRVRPPSDGPTP